MVWFLCWLVFVRAGRNMCVCFVCDSLCVVAWCFFLLRCCACSCYCVKNDWMLRCDLL